jgi:RNA polymerase-binding transcription factor DksA
VAETDTTVDALEAARLLVEEEARLRGLLCRLESGGVIERAGREERLVAPEDTSLDAGSELAERELELGLLTSLESELRDVERARERLRDGEYGRCTTCGANIASARLRAMPTTEHCIAHA